MSSNTAWISHEREGGNLATGSSTAEDSQKVVTIDGISLTDSSPAEGEGLSKEVIHGVKKFFFFLGWPRSGHSIVASLLNAHPNIVVSNQ